MHLRAGTCTKIWACESFCVNWATLEAVMIASIIYSSASLSAYEKHHRASERRLSSISPKALSAMSQKPKIYWLVNWPGMFMKSPPIQIMTARRALSHCLPTTSMVLTSWVLLLTNSNMFYSLHILPTNSNVLCTRPIEGASFCCCILTNKPSKCCIRELPSFNIG